MSRILLTATVFMLCLVTTPGLASAQTNAKVADAKANAAAKSTTAKVDLITLAQGEKDFADGNYVAAEKGLRAVLGAIDEKKMPEDKLTRCLIPLSTIYQSWGWHDEALEIAKRYGKHIRSIPNLDPITRAERLDKNAAELADILTALDRSAEAEAYLRQVLAQAEKHNNIDPVRTLNLLVKLAHLADAQGEREKSGQTWKRVIELGEPTATKLEQQLPTTRLEYASCIAALAAGYEASDRLPDALLAYQRLLAKQKSPNDAEAALSSRVNIAMICANTDQYELALEEFGKALDAQRLLARDSGLEAEILSRMAAINKAQGKDSEASRQWELASIIYEKAIASAKRSADAKGELMGLLNQFQIVEQQAGHYPEAIKACEDLLKLRQAMLKDDHPLTTATKSDLGALYGASENYDKARQLLQEAVSYWKKRETTSPLQLARALNDLAFVERGVGSFKEAEADFRQALKLRTDNLKPEDMRLAQTYSNLATVLLDEGDYSQAVALLERASEIYRGHGRIAQEPLSTTLLTEARVFRSQGLLDKAIEYCSKSLAALPQNSGNADPRSIEHYNTLAALCIARGKLLAADKAKEAFAEAENNSRRAWQLCEQNHLQNEPIAGATLYQKARVEYQLRQTKAAKEDWQAALKIQHNNGQKAQEAQTLNYLASLTAEDGTAEAAEPLYRKSLEMQGSVQAHPEAYYITSCKLAEILHDKGQIPQAMKLVQDAVKVIETPRAKSFGAEGERAEYFAEFAAAFDLLVKWNLEQGNVDKAFEYAERGRNRTFLDQLSLVGVDLRETLSKADAEKLLPLETELRSQLGTLRAQALAANQAGGPAALVLLAKQVEDVQTKYAKVWTDIRNASPYYSEQRLNNAKQNSLQSVRQQLDKLNSLMLFYFVGDKKSYLLVIDPNNPNVQTVPLEVPAALAGAMKVQAGPVTRSMLHELVYQYLVDLRNHAGGRGLAGIVESPRGVLLADQRTALAEVLLPSSVRTAVEQRKPQSVIIVPDGALHELPFDALLLEQRPNEKYLLDVFPPIAYAPSANILMNLLQRPAPDAKVTGTLTLGNPKYLSAPPNAPAIAQSQRSFSDISQSAYLGLGGQLPLLPKTENECVRITDAFAGNKVTTLLAERATEHEFRNNLRGSRFIHLAAHGLVDLQPGNLFGAIALTPPVKPVDSAEDDGFLSVHEIFNLPLSGCELVVLSACQTNVGPDRPLEAGSTIAQAFLAAGVRRTVCSHWNVDDASTAELMGTFFEQIAKARQANNLISYATALHEAQKAVRSNPGNPKWSSPYYWAPFVLIGPPQ